MTTTFTESTAGLNSKSKQWQALDGKRQQAQATVAETSAEWQQLHLRVHMFTACAVINLQVLPEKLNPLVRPLMEAIKREENTLVQGYAASYVAKLLQNCAGRSPCPNGKIIKNLCASACVDSSSTPSSACPVPPTQENAKGYMSQCSESIHPFSGPVSPLQFKVVRVCWSSSQLGLGRMTQVWLPVVWQ